MKKPKLNLELRKLVEEIVFHSFQRTPEAPANQILQGVEPQLESLHVEELHDLKGKVDRASSEKDDLKAKIGDLEKSISSIPPKLQCKSLTLPSNTFDLVSLLCWFLLGLVVLLVDGASMANYLVYKTDNLLMAIMWSVIVSLFPFVELAALSQGNISEQKRTWIIRVQFVLFALATVVYLILALAYADPSIGSLFAQSKNDNEASIEKYRMVAQVVAGLLAAGAFFGSGLNKLMPTPPPNPEFVKLSKKIDEQRKTENDKQEWITKLLGGIKKIELSHTEGMALARAIVAQLQTLEGDIHVRRQKILRQLNEGEL